MDRDLEYLMKKLHCGHKLSLRFCQKIANEILQNHCDKIEHNDHNNFFYEICPIINICRYIPQEKIDIEFCGDRRGIDGILHLNSGVQKIEITTAINPHAKEAEDAYRGRYGHSPRPTPIPDVEICQDRHKCEPLLSSQKFDQKFVFPILQRSLRKKVDKAKKNLEYKDAWLGIVFDDYICPPVKEEKCRRKRLDPLCQNLLGCNNETYNPFSRVFILGVSGTYLFDSCSGKSIIMDSLANMCANGS